MKCLLNIDDYTNLLDKLKMPEYSISLDTSNNITINCLIYWWQFLIRHRFNTLKREISLKKLCHVKVRLRRVYAEYIL